jgi:hypothetical protein
MRAPMFTTFYTHHDGDFKTVLSVSWFELSDARRLAAHLCADKHISGVRITDPIGADVAIWPRPDAVEAATGVKGSPEHHRASHGPENGPLVGAL